MKPPPRARSQPNRYLARKVDPEQLPPGPLHWKRTEQKQLLKALRKLGDTVGGTCEIDYAFLNKHIPQRTIPEIRALAEALKAKVITFARHRVNRQRREETRLKKPLDFWRDMAFTVSGAFENTICAAFSQMFIVSSTEPRSLRHSDPPRSHPSDRPTPPGDRTIPFRPMPHPVVPGGQLPGASSAARPLLILKTSAPAMGPAMRLLKTPAPAAGPAMRLLKTPAPAMGPATRLPAPSQVFRLVTATVYAPQPQPSTATPVPGPSQPQHPPITSQASSVSVQPLRQMATPPASPRVPVRQPPPSTAISSTPSAPAVPSSPSPSSSCFSSPVSIPATATSATDSCSTPPRVHSCSSPTPAPALHARFGRTSKYAREDSPRVLGMKCIVDFENIYKFLSGVHDEQGECSLTAMESAVVLDLLMSLPEELPLLNCNQLKRHMLKVHTELSAPAKMPRELLQDQMSERQHDGIGVGQERITPNTKVPQKSSQDQLQTQVGSGGAIGPNPVDGGRDRMNATEESPGNLVGTEEAEGSVAVGSAAAQRGDGQAQNQSSVSSNAVICKHEKSDWGQAGLCPLNPFMVPLKLLARQEVEQSSGNPEVPSSIPAPPGQHVEVSLSKTLNP